MDQLKDIVPSVTVAAVMSTIVFVEGLLIPLNPLPLFSIQLLSGALLTIAICELFHLNDYLYIKEIIIEKFFTSEENNG